MDDQATLYFQTLRMPRRIGAVVIAVGTLLLLSAGCSEEGPKGRVADVCKNPPEIEFPGGLPEDFPWPDDVPVTEAQASKRFVTITGFAERSVEDLFEIMQRELEGEDFDIINTDFEGFEAELYFAKGDSLAGIAALREGPCDGFVRVNVVYDPLETEAGRDAVRKTRELTGQTPTPGG